MLYPDPSTPPASTSTSSNNDMISLGLQRITKLLQALKSPQCATPIIHIAGTNGKGSVSAYIASMLHTADIRVGRFNSPHLVDEWDCIRLREKVVEEDSFRKAREEVERVNRSESLEATPFEVLTATAFSLFAQSDLDVAVVEVGMGGEGDATNVVPASKTLLSILTAVDLDHQGFLGNTVGEIAKVKSGITREGGDLVVSKQGYPEVVEVAQSIARQRGATVWQAGGGRLLETSTTASSSSSQSASIPLSPASVFPPNPPSLPSVSPSSLSVKLPLPGSYQLDNSTTAALAVQLLRSLPRTTRLVPRLASISDEAMRQGIERTTWDGRLQWLDWSPPAASETGRILLDGAHNPSSANLLASYLASLSLSERPTTLVFGLSAPRAASDVLEPLLHPSTGIKRVVCVEFSRPAGMPWVRSTPAEELYKSVADMGVEGVSVERCGSVKEAFELGVVGNEETVVVAGSLYLVADALRFVRGQA
ncbi:dihydrofolate synthase [Sporobolomyces salmoneus]|uniref:dihydrofolate synthase n=1 Tax=Sporobolomyces salmoneus TaxID=183962 RepID=UPI00317C74C4